MTEKVNSSNLFTILGLDEEFQETLELEISNKAQNEPFYLTKANDSSDGSSSWNLGVSGEPCLTAIFVLIFLVVRSELRHRGQDLLPGPDVEGRSRQVRQEVEHQHHHHSICRGRV